MSQLDLDLNEVKEEVLDLADSEIVKDVVNSAIASDKDKGVHLEIDHQMEDGVEIGLSVDKKDINIQLTIPL